MISGLVCGSGYTCWLRFVICGFELVWVGFRVDNLCSCIGICGLLLINSVG